MKQFAVMCLLAVLAVPAFGSITGVTGDFVITTPADVSENPVPTVAGLDVFAESSNVTPTAAVQLDHVNSGLVNSTALLVPGTTIPGKSYDSYFIFSDPVVQPLFFGGTVSFSEKIVGVEVLTDGLNSGTPFFQNPSVYYGYPFTSPLDGLELNTYDRFDISSDRHTFTFSNRAFAPGDRVRILTTATPEPMSLLSLGGMALGLIRRRKRN